jgi:hypothetical protein
VRDSPLGGRLARGTRDQDCGHLVISSPSGVPLHFTLAGRGAGGPPQGAKGRGAPPLRRAARW